MKPLPGAKRKLRMWHSPKLKPRCRMRGQNDWRFAVMRQVMAKPAEELRKRQMELEASIMSRSETSVELTIRSRELEQLQRIANGMSLKLELLDVEANAPDRIKKRQPAVPTGIGAPAIPMPEPTTPIK
jgi:hypothetical protein